MLRTTLGLLASALAALVYQNASDAPFIFDDRYTVLLNPSIAGTWSLGAVLLHNVARPVVNLSYAIDARVWGISSFGFHISNLLLHITAVAAFYGWCTRALTDASSPAPGRRVRATRRGIEAGPEWAAFFGAATLALHPAMSAAVMYVSARSEILAAIFFLACLTFARRAIVEHSTTSGAIAMACGALAIGSSSSAAALPLIVLAYDAWVLRDTGWQRRATRVYGPAFAAVLIAAAVHGLRLAPTPHAVLVCVLSLGTTMFRYLAMLVVPRATPLFYDTSDPLGIGVLSLVLLAGAAALAWLAIARRASRPLVAFGVCWFVAVLAPTALVPVRDPIAEHRVYLAAAGLLLAAVSVLAGLLASRASVRAGAGAIVALLAWRTHQRNVAWLEPLPLWRAAVERAPGSWVAHRELGEVLREAGLCGAADAEFRRTGDLHPGFEDRQSRTSRCEASK